LIITIRFMPFIRLQPDDQHVFVPALASSKIACGGCLKVMAISEARARSRLPVRR
jgi:hypothetical protein